MYAPEETRDRLLAEALTLDPASPRLSARPLRRPSRTPQTSPTRRPGAVGTLAARPPETGLPSAHHVVGADVLHKSTVADLEDAVGSLGDRAVVGDDQERGPGLLVDLPEVVDQVGVDRVELPVGSSAGRSRAVHERSGDRDACSARRELVRVLCREASRRASRASPRRGDGSRRRAAPCG